MNKANNGGNPPQDRKESVHRFKTIVEPKFSKRGFTRINKKSHTIFKDETRTMVFCTSSPSQGGRTVNDFKQKIKKYTKEMGVESFYIVFSRDFSDWSDKPTYLNTLRNLMNYNKVKGICVGNENLEEGLNMVESNERFYLIK